VKLSQPRRQQLNFYFIYQLCHSEAHDDAMQRDATRRDAARCDAPARFVTRRELWSALRLRRFVTLRHTKASPHRAFPTRPASFPPPIGILSDAARGETYYSVCRRRSSSSLKLLSVRIIRPKGRTRTECFVKSPSRWLLSVADTRELCVD